MAKWICLIVLVIFCLCHVVNDVNADDAWDIEMQNDPWAQKKDQEEQDDHRGQEDESHHRPQDGSWNDEKEEQYWKEKKEKYKKEHSEKNCCPCIYKSDLLTCAGTTAGFAVLVSVLGFTAAGILAGSPAAAMMSVVWGTFGGWGTGVIAMLQSLGAAGGYAKIFAVCQSVFVGKALIRGDCCECPFEFKLFE